MAKHPNLPRRRPRHAWIAGITVLVALLGAVVWMLDGERRVGARLQVTPTAPPVVPAAPLVAPQAQVAPRAAGPAVRGSVRLPDGAPAGGATVVVERATTAWPEWRSERFDQLSAITGVDGTFQFSVPDTDGLLVRFEHPDFAGGVADVLRPDDELQLVLRPAFELTGYVTTDTGAPVPNARVAIESVPGDDRRVEVRVTGANGRYAFSRLPAGPVRLVARHDAWQPTALPAVVVGSDRLVRLAFSRPAAPPLRGRVVAAATQQPLADAQVELLPLNGRLGLVDPITTRTAADGSFVLTGLARSGMRLLVRHPEHGAVTTTQTVGVATTPLTVELPRRSLVSGRLVADRQPPWRAGDTLRLRDAAGQLVFTRLGADGTFRFDTAISPGWANIAAAAATFVFERGDTTDVDVRIDETMVTELELPVTAPAVLHGRLVGQDGAAVANASLVRTKLLADGARTITDAAAQFDLGAFGSQVAQLFTSDRDQVVATTAADGTFVVRGIAPGPLLLRVAAAGHGSRLLRHTVGAVGGEQDLGDVVLPKGRRMQGRVLRDGRPFAGATVTVVGNETQASAITDASGSWRVDDLVPGEYRVRARLASLPTGSRVRTERVAAAGPTPNVVVVLDAGRTVRGEVLGSDGQAVAGAIVSVAGSAGASALSDGNGDFVLDLPDRVAELQVALPDRSNAVTVAVPAGDQRLTVRLDTPPVCTLTATVAGLPGRMLQRAALLRWTRAGDDDVGDAVSRWVELPDGELECTSCPVGRVRIEVWCEGYVPAVVERDCTANAVVALGELLLEPGCRLRGLVRGPDGAPVANARVLVGDAAALDAFEPGTVTAADGAFTVTGISGRSAQLTVAAPGFAVRSVELQLPADVLAPDPFVVTLAPGATIVVAVGDAAARSSVTVELRRAGRLLASAEVGEDGTAVFADRGAGESTVHVAGSVDPGRTVLVEPGARDVRVDLH